MQHEHDGHCCQLETSQMHEHHEHLHAALPLGHICTGACLHEAAEASALAVLREQQAEIEQFQSRSFDTAVGTKEKDRKAKKKRARLGTLSLVPLTTAA